MLIQRCVRGPGEGRRGRRGLAKAAGRDCAGAAAVEVTMHTMEVNMHMAEVTMYTMVVNMHTAEVTMHTMEVTMHTVEVTVHTMEVTMHTVVAALLLSAILPTRLVAFCQAPGNLGMT